MAPRPPRGSGSVRGGRQPEEEDLESLKRELEHEERLRDTIEWSNAELERSIQELAEELENVENSSPTNELNNGAGLNEWYVRLESQLAINEQLEQNRKWLELELEQAKQQAASGTFPEAMNFDMDSLTESELIRMVKHMERARTDLYSTLRDLEWKLDKEGKEYHRLSETRAMYQAELRHYTRTLDRLRAQQIHSGMEQSDFQSPHSGFTRWGPNSSIKNNLRIIDAKKGPIRKTVGVKSLPKIANNKENEKQSKGQRKRRGNKKSESTEEKGESGSGQEESTPGNEADIAGISTEHATDDSGVLVVEQTLEETKNLDSKESDGQEDSNKEDTEDKDTED